MGLVFVSKWWALAIRGLIALLFGVLTLFWPDTPVTLLVLLFGTYMLMDSFLATFAAFKARQKGSAHWWAPLFRGFFSLTASVLPFFWKGITTPVLLYLIAAWAVITGISELGAAIWLRHKMTNELALALSGIVSMLTGLLLTLTPNAQAPALVWLISAYVIISGGLLIALALGVSIWSKEQIEIEAAA